MRTQLDQHKIHSVLHNVSGNFTSILAPQERVGDGKETSVQNFWRYKASTDGNRATHSLSWHLGVLWFREVCRQPFRYAPERPTTVRCGLLVIRQEPFVGPEKPSYMPTSRY